VVVVVLLRFSTLAPAVETAWHSAPNWRRPRALPEAAARRDDGANPLRMSSPDCRPTGTVT